jgi:endonuclease/exonuclease/phosphatase family metal-dependent hydrolase
MVDLKKEFLRYVKKEIRDGNNLVRKDRSSLRFATYNVHYWTNVWEKNRKKQIFEDIEEINADVLILQEVVIGNRIMVEGKPLNAMDVIPRLESLGYNVIFCSSTPTWWNILYGNLLCVKNKLVDIADVSNINSPGMEIDNVVFEKSKIKGKVSGGKEGTSETRCFIKFTLQLANKRRLVVVGTHLDVHSEKERRAQMKAILEMLKVKHSRDMIVLMGDFNTTDIDQYSDTGRRADIQQFVYGGKLTSSPVFKILSAYGMHNVLTAPLTTWSNIQVDYIFTKNIRKSRLSPQVMYTPNSDHLPVILDIHM